MSRRKGDHDGDGADDRCTADSATANGGNERRAHRRKNERIGSRGCGRRSRPTWTRRTDQEFVEIRDQLGTGDAALEGKYVQSRDWAGLNRAVLDDILVTDLTRRDQRRRQGDGVTELCQEQGVRNVHLWDRDNEWQAYAFDTGAAETAP